MQRDTRIDAIRGFAMVTIIINHLSLMIGRLGLHGPQIPTVTTASISSAAEIFVALSGYMVGMVYVNKVNGSALILKRAGKLYAWNIVLFAVATAFALVGNIPYNAVFRLTPIITDPFRAVTFFLLLTWGPFLVDILHLYIILLLVSPLALWILRRSPVVLVLISILIYCGFQLGFRVAPEIGGSPNPIEADRWRFHPLAWQLIFFAPMAAGSVKLHVRLFQMLEQRRLIFWVTLAIFVGVGVAKTIPTAPHFYLADRGTLGPIRLLHSLLVLLLYAGLVTLLKDHLQNPILRALSLIGRHSLNVFILSSAANFLAVYIWLRLSLGWGGYATLTIGTVLLIWAAAKYWDNRKVAKLAATN